MRKGGGVGPGVVHTDYWISSAGASLVKVGTLQCEIWPPPPPDSYSDRRHSIKDILMFPVCYFYISLTPLQVVNVNKRYFMKKIYLLFMSSHFFSFASLFSVPPSLLASFSFLLGCFMIKIMALLRETDLYARVAIIVKEVGVRTNMFVVWRSYLLYLFQCCYKIPSVCPFGF